MADPSSLREAARLDAQLDAALDVGQRSRCGSAVVPRLGLRTADPTSDPDFDAHTDFDVDGDDSAMQPETPRSPSTAERGDNIRVFVRVRPPNLREGSAPCRDVIRVDASAGTVHLYAEPPRNFAFDGVLGEHSMQEEVFKLVGSSVGETCLEGYNGSMYVYGQTGSGKTYTMQGPVTSVPSMHSDERRGIMCRILDKIFSEIGRRHQNTGGVEYTCKCSYLEIYKEQITDLLQSKDLNDPGSTNLQVREDINRGVYVERLSEHSVWTLTDALHVLWKGLHQRHVGATQMNELSSRSHAVFTLILEATSTTSGGVTSTRVARLNLIDLAGSERQSFDPHNQTLHESLRVKEAGAINRSLSALTNVIMSLSHAGRRRNSLGGNSSANNRRHFVRYRDSRLTFLLRDSLGGNSKTVIVACVSPSALCFGETLSTLKFAARAKHIRCAAVMNEEYSGTVESLMLEVKSLKQQLELLSTRGLISGVANSVSQASLPPAGPGSELRSQRAGGTGGTGNACDREDQFIETLINDGNEDLRRLYGPRRIRRLEILLAAALERERRCELRRHKLDKFTQFLNALLERKEAYFDAVRDYFSHLVDHASIEGCFLPELMARLVVFRQQLSSMSTDGRRLAADMLSGDGDATEDRLLVSPSFSELGARNRSFSDQVSGLQGFGSRSPSYSMLSGAGGGGEVAGVARAGTRRGTKQHLQLRTPSTRILRSTLDSPNNLTESAAALPSPIDGVWFAENTEDFADDEIMLLRTENRLLRRQLENHPGLQRLGAENRLLREHLASLVQQHALAREEPPWPRGHKHQRQAFAGKMSAHKEEGHSGLNRERSLTRTSKSSILGQRHDGSRGVEGASPKHTMLSKGPFPGIEDATQISPSTSSAESDTDESERLDATSPVKSRGSAKMGGAADATSFLPMMAREVEELLRVKGQLEEDVKQLMRAAAASAAEKSENQGATTPAVLAHSLRSRLYGAVLQGSSRGGGDALTPRAKEGAPTDIDTRVASEILQGTAEALQFAEGMLAKGKGETLLLSSAGAGGTSGAGGTGDAVDGDEDLSPSPNTRARSVEGLDERDVFMSLMRSLPSERPALTRQGFASSAPHLSPSAAARSLLHGGSPHTSQGTVGLHRGGHSAAAVATLRASNSTGSTNARLMRNRSTLQLHRIAELPMMVASADMEAAGLSPAAASNASAAASPRSALAATGALPLASDASDSNEMLKEAAQKVRQLCHHLELVCDAYRDMREQLKPLHEEYFRRLDECKFLEAQCRRLDVHCRLLEERALAIEGGTGSRAQTLSNLISSGLQDIRLRGARSSTGSSAPSSQSSPGASSNFPLGGASGRKSVIWTSATDSPVVGGAATPNLSLDLGAVTPIGWRGHQMFPQGIDTPSSAGMASPIPMAGTPSQGGADGGQRPCSWSLPQGGVVLSRAAGPEVPPRGLLYAASVQELRLESQPHGVSISGGATAAPWKTRDYLRRVSSAPQLSVMHSTPGLLGADQASVLGLMHDGASTGGQTARSVVAGVPTFSSSTFLSLARQPGAKVAALQYLMTTIGEAQFPAEAFTACKAAAVAAAAAPPRSASLGSLGGVPAAAPAIPGVANPGSSIGGVAASLQPATRVVIPGTSMHGATAHSAASTAAVSSMTRIGSKGSTPGLERFPAGLQPVGATLRCAGVPSHASSTGSIGGAAAASVAAASGPAPSAAACAAATAAMVAAAGTPPTAATAASQRQQPNIFAPPRRQSSGGASTSRYPRH